MTSPDRAQAAHAARERLTLAAARILARQHRPGWRPSSDAELDAWAAGFNTGWAQGFAAGRSNA